MSTDGGGDSQTNLGMSTVSPQFTGLQGSQINDIIAAITLQQTLPQVFPNIPPALFSNVSSSQQIPNYSAVANTDSSGTMRYQQNVESIIRLMQVQQQQYQQQYLGSLVQRASAASIPQQQPPQQQLQQQLQQQDLTLFSDTNQMASSSHSHHHQQQQPEPQQYGTQQHGPQQHEPQQQTHHEQHQQQNALQLLLQQPEFVQLLQTHQSSDNQDVSVQIAELLRNLSRRNG